MDRNNKVTIINRHTNRVGYTLPELGVRRQLQPGQPTEITFGELEKLSFDEGGSNLLKRYLVITDPEVREQVIGYVEPEYFYGPEDVKRILLRGSLDEFLDCLDFSPAGVLEMVKDFAVELEINDLKKREAILEKLSFDVTKAIEIKNVKTDAEEETENDSKPRRRVSEGKNEPIISRRRTAIVEENTLQYANTSNETAISTQVE